MVRIGGMRSRTTLPSKDIESLGIMQSLLIDRAINARAQAISFTAHFIPYGSSRLTRAARTGNINDTRLNCYSNIRNTAPEPLSRGRMMAARNDRTAEGVK
jgi:hypothetical protein